MRGSKSLGRGTGQRCCSKTWDEEFKSLESRMGQRFCSKT